MCVGLGPSWKENVGKLTSLIENPKYEKEANLTMVYRDHLFTVLQRRPAQTILIKL